MTSERNIKSFKRVHKKKDWKSFANARNERKVKPVVINRSSTTNYNFVFTGSNKFYCSFLVIFIATSALEKIFLHLLWSAVIRCLSENTALAERFAVKLSIFRRPSLYAKF